MSITPTGRLVYDGEPVTPEWFAARREGITGTDLPKILGLSKYGNALSVWLDKRDEGRDDAASEAARWGNLLEDVVAQEWACRNETAVTPVGVIANVDHDWQRASLDRLVTACPDGPSDGTYLCGLEVKTRSAYVRGNWQDGEPDDVLAQVSWGLLVTGLDHAHIAVLIGGQTMLQFRVDRDEQLEQYLVDAARPVWEAVLSGDPPAVHPDAEGVLIKQLNMIYQERAGERELPLPLAEDWILKYREASDLERSAKRVKDQAKAALVQMLDDGDTGVIDGVPQFTYRKPDESDAVTADNLRALRETWPNLYRLLRRRGVITTTTASPRFNLKRSATR